MEEFSAGSVVFQEDLQRFDAPYSRIASIPVTDVPDGCYSVLVEQVKLDRTRSSGNPMITWSLRIQDGEHTGRTIFKNRVITEKTLTWVREDLLACGIQLTKFSELASRVDEMQGLTLEAVKRTKESRSNVYFVRRQEDPVDDSMPF